MNAIEAILSRKSSPRLQDPAPSEKELEIIYKAALRAPDHGALKPWKFINVSGDGRKKLADAALNAIEKSDPESAKKNKEKIPIKVFYLRIKKLSQKRIKYSKKRIKNN